MLRHVNPFRVWMVTGLASLVAAVSAFLSVQYPSHPASALLSLSIPWVHIAAYVLAGWLALRIQHDHAAPSQMRLAWRLIAATAAVSIVRHIYEWISSLAGWGNSMPGVSGLRQIPIVLSLLLLTAGLLAVWSSFAAIGLGVRFRRSDYLWAAAILFFVPWIIVLRSALPEARSPYLLLRFAQTASPVLLAAPALIGLALHRVSQEMGGGQMAAALRCLTAFLALRLVALAGSVSPLGTGNSWAEAVRFGIYTLAIWLFALAVVYRWRLTLAAEGLANRYLDNPDREIIDLSRSAGLSSPGKSGNLGRARTEV